MNHRRRWPKTARRKHNPRCWLCHPAKMPGQKRTVVEERRTGRQEAKARVGEAEQRIEPDPPPRYDDVFFRGA